MKKLIPIAFVAAALALSACSSSVKQSLSSAVSSLGSSSSVQMHFTATVSGAGTTKTAAVLRELSLDVDATNPSGGSVSSAGTNVDEDVTINLAGTKAVQVRTVGGDAYVEINLSSLSGVSGIDISAQELSAVQLLIGNRWFEIPQSLVASEQKLTIAEKAKAAKIGAIEGQVLTAVASLIDKSKYTTLATGGYRETGTLLSVEKAVLPLINQLTGKDHPLSPVPGRYTLTLTLSGSTATGGSISVTAPNPPNGNATVALHVTVTHGAQTIVAPTGATVLSPSFLKSLTGTAAA